MADSSGSHEFDFKAVLETVKRDTNGPEQRAGTVLNVLAAESVSNYDALCFAVEYLASLAGTMPWLEAPARDLVRLLYIAHYIRGESVEWLQGSILQGGPSEPESTTKGTTI